MAFDLQEIVNQKIFILKTYIMNCNTATTPRRTSQATQPQWVRIMNELSQMDKKTKNIKGTHQSFSPKANIVETEDNYNIQLTIPGYSRDEITINVDKNTLIISSSPEHGNDAKYILKEFNKTDFKKSFKLGDVIDTQNIDAKLEAGILSITLDKKEEQKPRSISVS